MIPDHVMRWLAIHFGKRVDWDGPVVFGHGYLWCGRVWFPPQKN
jgi:hypothetical protein